MIKNEFSVWINPYSGSSGYVVKTFDDEDEAKEFAGRHLGIRKHGGKVEHTITTSKVIYLVEPEVKKEFFPHTVVNNRRR